MRDAVTVRVPATSANLGPGFDCLALALDCWNEGLLVRTAGGLEIEIEGEGAGCLERDEHNLVVKAARTLFARQGYSQPGLRLHCKNQIPLGSGLGSSAAATVMGLVGANALLGEPLDQQALLNLAVELEGHPDNAAAAVYGGLTVVSGQAGDWLVRRYDVPPLRAALVLPEYDLPTHAARAALPALVPLRDAVFNLGRVILVVDALRSGDLDLLGKVMDDRLHQPYRLPLIPGAAEALAAARQAGAAAMAISGAGPSLIAFASGDPAPIAQAMASAFGQAGLAARAFNLASSNQGAVWF